MKKKFLSILLAALLLLTLVPTVALAVDPFSIDCPICKNGDGKDTCDTCEKNGKITFATEITTEDGLKDLFSTGGSGYLANDITATATLTVALGKTVDLCLNGKVLNLDGKGNITVNGTLNLFDCGATPHTFKEKTIKIGMSEQEELKIDAQIWALDGTGTVQTVTGGVITGGKNMLCGGVSVSNIGTFKMYGGTICGNAADVFCGGVDVSGKFEMYGGAICGNAAGISGGLLMDGGTFTLGGTAAIYSNTSTALKNETNVGLVQTMGTKITLATGAKAPQSTMNVGVTIIGSEMNSTTVGVFTDTNAVEAYANYFFSDDEAYAVKFNAGNYLELVEVYPVNIVETVGGKVAASASKAEKGTEINLTVKADSGYSVKGVSVVTTEDGNTVEVKKISDGTYTFILPDEAVTVKAEIEKNVSVLSKVSTLLTAGLATVITVRSITNAVKLTVSVPAALAILSRLIFHRF